MEIMCPRGSGRYPILVPTIVVHKGFEYELCKCLGINVGRIIFDEFEYESEMEHFCHWILRKQLNKPLDYTGGLKMHNDKEELMKDLIKKRANDELESDPLVPTPIEMLKEEIENSEDGKMEHITRTHMRCWGIRESLEYDRDKYTPKYACTETKPVGEWIYEDKVVGKRYYRCSNCTGTETLADEDEAKWWRFCPRCGAKMFTKEEK